MAAYGREAQATNTFDVELKWHNLTHACYSIFEDGQEVGQVVILAEHEAEFEALFNQGEAA